MTLKANNLSCTRQQNTLFAELSFSLQPGEIILIEGDNGSGKSSLLRLLVGLSTPDAGSVLWQGDCIQAARDEYVKQLHYVGHTNGIKLGLTVLENLELTDCLTHSATTPSFRGLSAESSAVSRTNDKATTLDSADKPRNDGHLSHAMTTLQSLSLTAHLNTQTKYLSAGQQRKIALAKLLMFPKPLWILDEPLTALDAHSQTVFIAALEAHLQQGGMCVMTSHHAINFQHITPISLRLSS